MKESISEYIKRQKSEILDNGLTAILKKIRTLLFKILMMRILRIFIYILIFPIVIVVHLIRPFILIRFGGGIRSDTLGNSVIGLS